MRSTWPASLIFRAPSRGAHARPVAGGKRLGRPSIAPKLTERIQAALAAPGRTEGVRKMADRMRVNPSTVQGLRLEAKLIPPPNLKPA